jgi:hypothetical protein
VYRALLADGTALKCLTGVDDHSRLCESAALMRREVSRSVCEALAAAMHQHGIPAQILTDNGKVFTGRFNQQPVEVLFDRICRENGVEHILTAPPSPTTNRQASPEALQPYQCLRRIWVLLRVAEQANPVQNPSIVSRRSCQCARAKWTYVTLDTARN